MSWSIVVDSSSDMQLSDLDSKDFSLTIVPLKIMVGEVEYIDDDAVDTDVLISEMKREKKGSSSACPSVGDFYDAFLLGDETICILLTGALSGTYNSASVARDMILSEYPDRKIHLIDTKATAGVLELTARKAAEYIEKGMEFDVLTKELDSYVKTLRLVFSLSNYDNLIKNGRMSFFAGAVASHLGIRAVSVNTEKGEISVVKKCRGEEKTLKTMVSLIMEKIAPNNPPILISHCKNENGAQRLKTMLLEKCANAQISIRPCKGLTTFYSMNGGILVAYPS